MLSGRDPLGQGDVRALLGIAVVRQLLGDAPGEHATPRLEFLHWREHGQQKHPKPIGTRCGGSRWPRTGCWYQKLTWWDTTQEPSVQSSKYLDIVKYENEKLHHAQIFQTNSGQPKSDRTNR